MPDNSPPPFILAITTVVILIIEFARILEILRIFANFERIHITNSRDFARNRANSQKNCEKIRIRSFFEIPKNGPFSPIFCCFIAFLRNSRKFAFFSLLFAFMILFSLSSRINANFCEKSAKKMRIKAKKSEFSRIIFFCYFFVFLLV